MIVENVIKKIDRIGYLIEIIETGIVHTSRFDEISELLKEYRDSLYKLEVKE